MQIEHLDLFCKQTANHLTQYNRYFSALMLNPPFYSHTSGRVSPLPRRALARTNDRPLEDWICLSKAMLVPKGLLCMILPTTALNSVIITAQRLNFGTIKLRPIYTRQGKSAKLMLISLKKNSNGMLSLLPSITLREENNAQSKQSIALFSGDRIDMS